MLSRLLQDSFYLALIMATAGVLQAGCQAKKEYKEVTVQPPVTLFPEDSASRGAQKKTYGTQYSPVHWLWFMQVTEYHYEAEKYLLE